MGSDTRREALRSLNESAGSRADLMRQMDKLRRRELEIQAELDRVQGDISAIEQRVKDYREGIIRAVAFLCDVHRVDFMAWACGTEPIARFVSRGRTFLLTACPEEDTPNTLEKVVQRCALLILDEGSAVREQSLGRVESS